MGLHAGAMGGSELRVRAIEGPWVIDASVMPSLPTGHTHAPTIIIAERASVPLQGPPG